MAFAGGALLADAAVETYIAGAPVRWWVVGAAIAYAAVTAATLRMRVGWRAQLTIALLAALGLIAATAWRPDGLADGIRLLGEPTTVVLSTLTAVALLVATIVVMRATMIPLAARLVVSLVAVYGIVAFAVAAWQTTAYHALLSGDSLWHVAPRWLQGATLGGLVVLPLSLLASLAGGLRRDARVWQAQPIIALGLSVTLVVSGLANAAGIGQGPMVLTSQSKGAVPADSSEASGTSTAGIFASTTAETREELRERLKRFFRAALAYSAAIPADRFDPQAIIATTGRDPVALFNWVRDSTTWVPYQGVLRGPVGVPMDREGNDLDRALLLAQLLKSTGQEVRLARGTLSDAAAAEIMRAIRPRPRKTEAATPAVTPEFNALVDAYTKDNPSDAAILREFVEQSIQSDARTAKAASDRSADQARALAAAIGLSNRAHDKSAAVVDLDRVKDHWWVQWRHDPDWTDLDPSLPGSQAGQRLTERQSTLATSDIDPSLFHEVRVRVTTERWEQGHLQETPVLTHVLRPSELYGLDVSLVHLPIAWPAAFDAVHASTLSQQANAVGLNQHEWLPALRIGSNLSVEFSFTDKGLKRTGRPGIGTTVERGLEAIPGLFGSSDDSADSSTHRRMDRL